MYLLTFIAVKYTPQEIYSFISTSSSTKYFAELHEHCFCPRTSPAQAYRVDRPQVQVSEDVLGESVGPGQKPEEPREAPAWPLGRLVSSWQAPLCLLSLSCLPTGETPCPAHGDQLPGEHSTPCKLGGGEGVGEHSSTCYVVGERKASAHC